MKWNVIRDRGWRYGKGVSWIPLSLHPGYGLWCLRKKVARMEWNGIRE
jgi:hypothetical protein